MNKETLIKAIIERLCHDQKLFFQAAQTAHKAATDPENIPDNKYETLALESSYLAQGQANRAQDLQHAIDLYTNLTVRRFSDGDQVYLSALVVIESEEGNRRSIFLGPAAGGLKSLRRTTNAYCAKNTFAGRRRLAMMRRWSTGQEY